MGSLGIDGLVSGLDTTSLINQLMQVEAAPQTLLKSKQSATSTLVTALQSLNTKVASLADSAATAAKPASWTAFRATSSATSVTATAGAGAQASALTFRTDAVAASQVSLVDPAALGSSAFTVKVGDKLTTVTAASGSADDIAAALNKAGAGVSATAVRTGTGTPATYTLQLTGADTGAAGAFQVFAGTKAQVEAGSATAVPLTKVRDAADAKITLFAGSPAEQQVSSSTNTFAGLMTGVDLTVSKVEADPVTVTVARDDAALKKLASGLVGALGVVLSEITSRTATTTSTGADGKTVVAGGLFAGQSAVRELQQAVQSAASYPVNGFSPSEAGISIGKDGTFTFDDAKFTAALAADPAKVQGIVSGLAERVAKVAKGASDSIDGTLTLKIKGQQGLVQDLGKQISDWDTRLELRREGLQKTYSALEVTLSSLQSQSSWLAGQLAGLSASG